MDHKSMRALLAIALLGFVAMFAAWYHTSAALRALRHQTINNELQSIAALLTEDQTLIRELQGAPYAEPGATILQSYLAKIRRDGVSKNAAMKQQLDMIAENNVAIATLVRTYIPRAQTTAFKTNARKFDIYAATWRDRWNSVMEIFMAGGNLPAAEVRFPSDFPDAIKTEMAVAY